jgi:mono/diheme cytochrome c family protein
VTVPLALSALLAAPIAAIAFAGSRTTASANTSPSTAASPSTTASTSTSAALPAARVPDLARGRYLVEQVGLCADCHTPRDARGQFLAGQDLLGAGIAMRPTVPMPWADVAPPIAGLPSLPDDAMAVHFLTTGELPGGRHARPPMPPFRFSPEDARDVVAWLRQRAPGAQIAVSPPSTSKASREMPR